MFCQKWAWPGHSHSQLLISKLPKHKQLTVSMTFTKNMFPCSSECCVNTMNKLQIQCISHCVISEKLSIPTPRRVNKKLILRGRGFLKNNFRKRKVWLHTKLKIPKGWSGGLNLIKHSEGGYGHFLGQHNFFVNGIFWFDKILKHFYNVVCRMLNTLQQ